MEGRRGPITAAGIVLGVGLGGFIDGILLRQILQWHTMMSARMPPVDLASVKYNLAWDGLFHVCAWLVVLAGVALLFHVGHRTDNAWSGRALAGGMIAGWGLYNLVEGIVDHQVLGLHHVRPGEWQLVWDVLFLISGVLLMLLGAALAGPKRTFTGRRLPIDGQSLFAGPRDRQAT